MSSLPSPPVTSDPAVHLHSQADPLLDPVIVPSDATTDDVEGWYLQRAESTATRSRQGIVIQHRAWKVDEVFKSEEDYLIGR